jgi:hypothetical protein
MVDQATLAPQIARAKAAGYSDDEIVSHLAQGIPEIKKATDAGYDAGEILSHLNSAKSAPKTEVPAPDDHGLSRRQAMSPLEKAVSPITEYWGHQKEISGETAQQVWRGVEQLTGAVAGAKGDLSDPEERARLWAATKGIGNIGLGALGYLSSPVSAAYRSVLGQPVEDITGIPREYTEFTAQLATPGVGFTKLPRAPGVAEPVPLIRPPAETARPDVLEAGQRLNEISPVSVPRAVTGGRTAQETGQGASNIPYVGQPVAEAVHTTLPAQLEQARNVLAAEHGEGTGQNVGDRVGATLREQAAAEQAAAQAEAAQQDAQATAEWQRTQQEREAAVAQQEQQAAQAAEQAVGPELDQRGMGEAVIGDVRAAHQVAETTKNRLYAEATAHDGTVSDEAVGSADQHVNADLRTEKGPNDRQVTTTPNLTPAAMDMRQSLKDFSDRARARVAAEQARVLQEAHEAGLQPSEADAPDPTGINLRTLETQRQDLLEHERGAKTPVDRRAARRIINAFDDWHEAAMQNHFDGDPGALQAYRDARTANRDFRQRFGYNKEDDADRLINKIVRGEADQHTGPLAVSDALTARNDKSGPLFTDVMAATGNNPNTRQAIRSGTWNKLSRDAPGVAQPSTLASAVTDAKATRKDIYDHLLGRGRDVAERVFTPEQRNLMRAHADTLFEAAQRRVAAAADAKASMPVPTKVEPGPIQQLVDQVIGGKTSGEALFKTLHGYAKKGGDVVALARVMRQLPAGTRGDLGSAFIREMGVSPTTKQFSLDHFVNHWNGLSSQAKSVMFGNAGPHVTALNDIATIAQRLKEVKGRFGNPSGSAKNVGFMSLPGILAAAVTAPKTTALAAAGYGAAHIAARVLASPAGASSIARYARAVERANREASLANMTAVKLAQRNVENTARSLAAVSGKQ